MNMHKQVTMLLLFLTLCACKKNAADQEPVLPERSVLIYIGANNNLHDDALMTVDKILEGAKSVPAGGLVVYLKTQFHSCLLKISTGQPVVQIDTIKNYTTGNSSDPAFLNMVIKDARACAPARSYGLVLWSHATSWSPAPEVSPESFGSDNFREMDIKDLKQALPRDWDYIMFDACSMSAMEVIYELKDQAKYILASPAEVLSSSFPYDQILPHLFGQEEELKTVARKFIDYYKTQPGLYASATAALIKTDEMGKMAFLTKNLLERKKPVYPYPLAQVQSMHFDKGGVEAYDFLSFMEHNYPEADLQQIREQLTKVVLFKDHTPRFFDVPIKNFCGLSIYPPVMNDPLRNYYNTLNWASASNWYMLFQ